MGAQTAPLAPGGPQLFVAAVPKSECHILFRRENGSRSSPQVRPREIVNLVPLIAKALVLGEREAKKSRLSLLRGVRGKGERLIS